MGGRPYLFGLAVDGARGVTRVVNILRREFEIAMAVFIYFCLDRGRDARCAGVPQAEGTLRVSRRIIFRLTNTNGRPVIARHMGGRFVFD